MALCFPGKKQRSPFSSLSFEEDTSPKIQMLGNIRIYSQLGVFQYISLSYTLNKYIKSLRTLLV